MLIVLTVIYLGTIPAAMRRFKAYQDADAAREAGAAAPEPKSALTVPK
jgi:hypothetical protein